MGHPNYMMVLSDEQAVRFEADDVYQATIFAAARKKWR